MNKMYNCVNNQSSPFFVYSRVVKYRFGRYLWSQPMVVSNAGVGMGDIFSVA